jgi:hypothetical protein
VYVISRSTDKAVIEMLLLGTGHSLPEIATRRRLAGSLRFDSLTFGNRGPAAQATEFFLSSLFPRIKWYYLTDMTLIISTQNTWYAFLYRLNISGPVFTLLRNLGLQALGPDLVWRRRTAFLLLILHKRCHPLNKLIKWCLN